MSKKEVLYKQQIQRLQQELKSVSRAQAQHMRNFTSSRVEAHQNSASFKNYKTGNDLLNFPASNHTNHSGESLSRAAAN